MCTCVGHDRVPCRNRVLGGARIPPWEKGNFEDILDIPHFLVMSAVEILNVIRKRQHVAMRPSLLLTQQVTCYSYMSAVGFSGSLDFLAAFLFLLFLLTFKKIYSLGYSSDYLRYFSAMR